MAHDLDAPIWDHPIPTNIKKIIRKLKVDTVRELSRRSVNDLMELRGVGPATVHNVDVWLSFFGLRLAISRQSLTKTIEDNKHGA